MLKENTKAPDFKLLDQDGRERSLSDFAGEYKVIYFYPKDDTPGCTKEACGIKDSYANFSRLNVPVIGISADSVASHKKFAEKYNLPFVLLSDPNKEIIKAYGAKGGLFTKRISYLLDNNGVIVKGYKSVDPSTHAGEIIKDIESLLK
jgi:peroxiredoxin Q/BCP